MFSLEGKDATRKEQFDSCQNFTILADENSNGYIPILPYFGGLDMVIRRLKKVHHPLESPNASPCVSNATYRKVYYWGLRAIS